MEDDEKEREAAFAFAVASLSLNLSSVFSFNKKISSAPKPNNVNVNVNVPTQASSLTQLSLSTPSNTSFKSTLSATATANPFHAHLSLSPHLPRPRDPSNAAALRRTVIVWFRNDLRLLDNECLAAANNDSISLLPVYCFHPSDYGKSSSGFDKTGPYRANFLLQSVSDLRRNLQARGSDLVVRVGNPETVLLQLAKAVGADAVYAHREVSQDDVKTEEKVEAAMKDENVEVKYFWGSTLYHMNDLPFKLQDMPSHYGGFRDRVHKLEIRNTIAALDQLKGMPSRGDVDPGEIPSLMDLGLNSSATMPQDGNSPATASMVGGETEALQRLKTFAAECEAQPHKGFKDGTHSIYGANFFCKISPWLAMGCLSPRTMYEELKNTASRAISASSNQNNGGSGSSKNGTDWLMYELLWRDFFRFTTKKYSSAKKQVEPSPATACAGAFA